MAYLFAEYGQGWTNPYVHTGGHSGRFSAKFKFKNNPALVFVGKTKEAGNLQKAFDGNFNTNVLYYMDKVQFVQKLKVNGQVSKLTGSIEFMVCDDQQCLPPMERPFDLKLE